MTFTLSYPVYGRGAWPNSGAGGTLSVAGSTPGPYYRAPTLSSVRMPGLTAALAIRTGTRCSINDYAVHRAVIALQPYFGTSADGILGPNTNAAIKSYQHGHQLGVDGVIGPQTCRSLFMPLINVAAYKVDTVHVMDLMMLMKGTITVETNWDPGAVGITTPQDLGICQINGPAHPNMSADDRFDPKVAINWMASFIDYNLKSMDYDVDLAIAAYNLGPTGAFNWSRAGRPQMWHNADVWHYIEEVKKGGS